MIQNKAITSQKLPVKLSFWHYLLIFTIVALAGSAILSLITPKAQTISLTNESIVSNYDQSQSNFKKINFSGREIILPETFGVYRVTQGNSSAEVLASQIINSNNLVLHKNIANYWVGQNSELLKSDYEKSFTFAETVEEIENDVKIIKSSAIQTCLNFFNKFSTGLNLITQEDSILFLDQSHDQNEVEERDAYVMQIPLTYELDGYPVFYENSQNYPFFCKVDNNYILRRLVFKDFFYNFELISQMPPISINRAVNNIKNGMASVISAESQISHIIDLNWINEADLYSVEVDYRYDDTLKIAYPFYKFSARLSTDKDNNIQAFIITPAVATAKSER